jgi:methylglyoxal synthase
MFVFYNFSLSKIDTCKIKNQHNIKVIGKKSNKKNQITQLIINQILSGEMGGQEIKCNCNG